MIPHIMTC